MQSQAPASRNPFRNIPFRNWVLVLGRFFSLAWLLAGLVALLWGMFGLYSVLVHKAPLAIIQVEGDINSSDRDELARRLKATVRGSYFGTDLVAIRDVVIASPWVESMSVQRRWPDGIRVLVIEKKAVARWGEKNYLSARGEIFQPKPGESDSGLPLLFGPTGKAAYVMEQYRSLNERFRPLKQQVVELHLTERMTWFLKLASGTEIIIDQSQFNDKLQRFFWLYEKQLKPYADRIARVDLRYRNGLAVSWKDGMSVPVVNNQLKKLEQVATQDGR
ncbi:cell division protein FtsQ [Fluviicoccus keumensis]|uniref:Cell division protein FtsQ n=1 Tax=Fluviicoccus keumensis TaxID=1435465 RepID=A0A4Q7YEH1_9GAMM|nr:cell division protein FtsQ/DivIB [Fluviicoccus keumensis]RZU35378.1 cell division protein FtsQ [Fluviicoccus keumensis]